MKSYFLLTVIFVSVILISCHRSNSRQEIFAALRDSISISGLTGDSAKLVKTAGIVLKVHDVVQGSKAISNMARKFGGATYSQKMQSVETGTKELKVSDDSSMIISSYAPQTEIAVRIPSGSLEDFLYSVDELGYLTSTSNFNLDDRSLQYLENILKHKNRTDVLQEAGIKKQNGLTSQQALAVKDQITDKQISNMAVDADVSYSLVNLSLFQNPVVRKEIIVNTILSDFQLPFGRSFSEAVKDSWQFFLNLILVVVNLWMFILVAIIVVLTYRNLYSKKGLSE